MTDLILVEDKADIRTIRFNRIDKKNAITQDMYTAMAEAVESAGADGCAAIVFLGQPGVFSAGNDIQDFMARAMSDDLTASPTMRFLKALATGKTAMIAAVDGLAIGVGVTMLMHCDLVYATARTTLKTPFLNLGLVPEAGSSLIAPRLMGQQRAFEMLALGETFSAEQAAQAGLINRLMSENALEETAFAAAEKLSAHPPEALALSRALLRGEPHEIVARIDEEAKLFAERLVSNEAREAFMAFMQKRTPNFKAAANG